MATGAQKWTYSHKAMGIPLGHASTKFSCLEHLQILFYGFGTTTLSKLKNTDHDCSIRVVDCFIRVF